MKRRTFLITGGIVGGGFVVGIGGLNYVNKKIAQYSGIGMGDGESLNAWVRIHPDNTVTLAVAHTEMGQGVFTALPMLIAEELEVEFDKIKVIHPQAEGPYTNFFMAEEAPRALDGALTMMQKVFGLVPNIVTGGSTAIRNGYDYQRMVGAMAREMLISAAAKEWKLDKSDCYAEKGFVINKSTKKSLSYGELAAKAAMEEAPQSPALKDKSKFNLIGKRVNRLDIPSKVNGSAEFGLDVRQPNMKFAVIRHPCFVGGKILSVQNEDEIRKMPGVDGLVLIDEGVAVVAKSTWHANNAANALKLEEINNQEHGHKDALPLLKDAMMGEPSKVWEDEGDIDKVIGEAPNLIEASYEVPYLAHACMEPLNCTVLVEGDRAEVWTGNQSSTFTTNGIAEGTGIDKINIKTNITFLGGGFGRRAETDFVYEAAKIAKEFPGIPVQLVYTREEDMRNDYYRPAVRTELKAALDDNKILGWKKKIGAQGALAGLMSRNVPMMPMGAADDPSSTEGMRELPYELGAVYTDLTCIELPVKVGTWRSVGHSQNAFFSESFMDECADALKRDPYELRKELLQNKPRHLAVLNEVAGLSNWGEELGPNRSRGIALHESFGSIVGEVAEITLNGKEIKVDKVYCVIDCGKIVNPAIIESQMQSGIVYGLTAALYGEISVKEGKIVQNNFPNYQMVQMKTMPEVVVKIMDSDEYPGGVGEPGTPPIAPALTNAIFAINRERIRTLPLSRHGFTFV